MRKKKRKRKRRAKRILGNDRGLMMICRDVRRRWAQYGENRKEIDENCVVCGALGKDIDHIEPMGSRPRIWEEIGTYARRMFENLCQRLCKECHLIKTNLERQRRKK